MARTDVTSNLSLYVDSINGNNSNNGLTSGTAWLTLQYAINKVAGDYDIKPGSTITINVLQDITEYVLLKNYLGSPSNNQNGVVVDFNGKKFNGTSSLPCLQSVGCNTYYYFTNVVFVPASGQLAVHADASSRLSILNPTLDLSASNCSGIQSISHSEIDVYGTLTLKGGGFNAIAAAGNGYLEFNCTSVVFDSTPTTARFAYADHGGKIQIYGFTSTGNFNGLKWEADQISKVWQINSITWPAGAANGNNGVRQAKTAVRILQKDVSSTASTTVTGLPFKPTSAIFDAVFINGTGTVGAISRGYDDGTNKACVQNIVSSYAPGSNGSSSIAAYANGATDYMRGSISSFTEDGCVITWTKTGSPTGTYWIICTYFGS